MAGPPESARKYQGMKTNHPTSCSVKKQNDNSQHATHVLFRIIGV